MIDSNKLKWTHFVDFSVVVIFSYPYTYNESTNPYRYLHHDDVCSVIFEFCITSWFISVVEKWMSQFCNIIVIVTADLNAVESKCTSVSRFSFLSHILFWFCSPIYLCPFIVISVSELSFCVYVRVYDRVMFNANIHVLCIGLVINVTK